MNIHRRGFIGSSMASLALPTLLPSVAHADVVVRERPRHVVVVHPRIVHHYHHRHRDVVVVP